MFTKSEMQKAAEEFPCKVAGKIQLWNTQYPEIIYTDMRNGSGSPLPLAL